VPKRDAAPLERSGQVAARRTGEKDEQLGNRLLQSREHGDERVRAFDKLRLVAVP